MIAEEDKFTAETLRMTSFPLFIPFGDFILNIPNYHLSDLNIKFVIYVLISFLSSLLGLFFLETSVKILSTKGK